MIEDLIVEAVNQAKEYPNEPVMNFFENVRNGFEHYAYFVPMEVGVGKSKRMELCLAFPKSSWDKLWGKETLPPSSKRLIWEKG